MNALKIALFSAAAIAFTAPAFAQTANTSKPAVSAPSAAPSETAKPAAKSDAKTETKAATHKGKRHHKHASARPTKSMAPATGSAKSSS